MFSYLKEQIRRFPVNSFCSIHKPFRLISQTNWTFRSRSYYHFKQKLTSQKKKKINKLQPFLFKYLANGASIPSNPFLMLFIDIKTLFSLFAPIKTIKVSLSDPIKIQLHRDFYDFRGIFEGHLLCKNNARTAKRWPVHKRVFY